ncbi:S-adenosyl-L-methionine-dependent tRNA 4-demethylwyosine synthase [Morus notabilis]|uniref:S-adenosyl-L-methionine-dependent tRNA 4-demethylwyosine synthase n=1 Tax=Morus notabilis TaxID=981085 RepID=UPI000CECE8DE|nr:S-adenosyl-L-methionine-dependent tRNA 4-demethylwyosine synthase [Morus notabilis]
MAKPEKLLPAMCISSVPARLTLLALLSATTFYCFYKFHRLRSLRISLNPNPNSKSSSCFRRGKLLFISETGTSKTLARRLLDLLNSNDLAFDLVDAKAYEPEDLPKETQVLIVASTWEDGKAPPSGRFFANWLAESVEDFRVGSLLLSQCKFAVFGVGSRAYGATYNVVARDLSKRMRGLGAAEMLPVWEGDVDGGDLEEAFDAWSAKMVKVLNDDVVENGGALSNGVGAESDAESDYETDEEYSVESEIVDLEDIAGKGPSRRSPVVVQTNGTSNGKKDMVTPVIRASLEKQGYKIIGSHSGVKVCRWTKSQLRGRGGCYKHSFYGIESHRCMEATPSLACANKCVFCWRHHTNPVGKSWQWKMDDPLEIVNSAIDQHTKMIKQMKGVPGVTLERLTEGLSPRHCALSLVGEPIMYPEINTLVDELHRRRISTFLVTNAQFPEKIKMLKPITQLYVSVDAATKDSLKAIDRPLFGDFWERFLDSLKALRDKQQRTVYRLTLVKGWNTEDVDAYFNLFSIGKPDFIEIKGVTYCGSSATSKLTMENVPWHSEVKAFSEALALKSQGEYEVACEHVHSCCVLLAKTEKFKINGQWFTWIEYEKFHDLVASGKAFDSKDYMAATPSWAVYGAEEGGFDPDQSRYKKERHHNRPNRATARPG